MRKGDDSDDEDPCCSDELKASNKLILKNIGICLLTFYCTYYCVSALMHGIFSVESRFDGREPFNFVAMSAFNFSNGAKETIAGFLSMEVTYSFTTLVISFALMSRIWDYAITITFVHFILSCSVMGCFPETWHWWCAIGIGCSWMVIMGETISFLLRKKQARRAVGQSLNFPMTKSNQSQQSETPA